MVRNAQGQTKKNVSILGGEKLNNRNVTFSTLPITELSDRRVTKRTVAAINFNRYKNKPWNQWGGKRTVENYNCSA